MKPFSFNNFVFCLHSSSVGFDELRLDTIVNQELKTFEPNLVLIRVFELQGNDQRKMYARFQKWMKVTSFCQNPFGLVAQRCGSTFRKHNVSTGKAFLVSSFLASPVHFATLNNNLF